MARNLSQAARDLYAAAYPVGPTTGSMAFTAWMRKGNLAPRDVAAKILCTEISVRAWASGRRVPTIELARRIELLADIPIAAWVEITTATAVGS
jgi:hypothetical protein